MFTMVVGAFMMFAPEVLLTSGWTGIIGGLMMLSAVLRLTAVLMRDR